MWELEQKTPNTFIIKEKGKKGEIARVFSENGISKKQAFKNSLLIKEAPKMSEFIESIISDESVPIFYRKLAHEIFESTKIVK